MSRLRRLALWTAAVAIVLAIGPWAWAMQKTIRSKVHNYEHAPVLIRRSGVALIEEYFSPTQLPIPGGKVKQSRVRYANRKGITPSAFMLKGDLVCQNQFLQPVQALELTIVLLDAFHQPILLPGQSEPQIVQRVMMDIAPKQEQSIGWEQSVSDLDIFEVAVVVTRVRFADGSMWQAPAEELVDVF